MNCIEPPKEVGMHKAVDESIEMVSNVYTDKRLPIRLKESNNVLDNLIVQIFVLLLSING